MATFYSIVFSTYACVPTELTSSSGDPTSESSATDSDNDQTTADLDTEETESIDNEVAVDTGEMSEADEDLMLLMGSLASVSMGWMTVSDTSEVSALVVGDDLEFAMNSGSGFVAEETDSDVMFTIGAWNTPDDFPATPQAMYDDSALRRGSKARYPASGYIKDFYGVQGYQAYAEIEPTTDGWGDFRVSLYIFQTLAPSVLYSSEVYRVPALDWTWLVSEDDGTSYDAIAFEDIVTKYFDGRTETRDLHWTRWVASEMYDVSDFGVPNDFSSELYTYPDTIVEPSKRAANDSGGLQEYASHTTSDVRSPSRYDCAGSWRSYCIEERGEEFYANIINDAGNMETHSKNFLTKTTKTSYGLYTNSKTVIRSMTEDNGAVTTRRKTRIDYDTSRTSGRRYRSLDDRSIDILEESQVNDADGDGKTNYTLSQVYQYHTGSTTTTSVTSTYSYEYDLEESAVDSDTYVGTLVLTYGSRRYNYRATLNASTGLRLTWAGSSSLSLMAQANETTDSAQEIDISFPEISSYEESENGILLQFDLDSGSFDGELMGNTLVGTWTNSLGEEIEIVAGPGYFIQDQSKE